MREAATLGLWLLLSTAAGCDGAPNGADGSKCFASDSAAASCGHGLFCEMTRDGEGRPVRERVALDRWSAVGTCKPKAVLGGACSTSEGCAVGVCLFANPERPTGLCGQPAP